MPKTVAVYSRKQHNRSGFVKYRKLDGSIVICTEVFNISDDEDTSLALSKSYFNDSTLVGEVVECVSSHLTNNVRIKLLQF